MKIRVLDGSVALVEMDIADVIPFLLARTKADSFVVVEISTRAEGFSSVLVQELVKLPPYEPLPSQ